MIVLACLSLPAASLVGQFAGPEPVTRRLPDPRGLRYFDADGDGDVDAVAGSGETGEVRLWLQAANGEFDGGRSLAAQLSSVRDILVADLDGDGDQDLSVAAQGPAVVWLENIGSGQFAPSMPLVGFGAVSPDAIVRQKVTDIDRDGRPEVLMCFDRSSSGQDSLVMLATDVGQPSFNVVVLASEPFAIFDIAAGDLDNDGLDDILIGCEFGARWFRNEGAAGFPVSVAVGFVGSPDDERVGAGDVDGDGLVDIISMSVAGPSRVGTLRYSPSPAFMGNPIQVSSVIGTDISAVEIIDVDGDARVDCLFGRGSALFGELVLVRGASVFGFGALAVLAQRNQSITSATLGDLDGDGSLEVGFGVHSGAVTARALDTSTAPISLDLTELELTETLALDFHSNRDVFLAAADFDGDGRDDLLVRGDDENEIALWRGDVSGEFSPQITIERFADVPQGILVGDFDSDGDLDIVYDDPTTHLLAYQFLENAAGSFEPAVPLSIPHSLARPDLLIDFDGDGSMDLVETDSTALLGRGWWRRSGPLSFDSFVPLPTTPSPASAGPTQIVDIDGDGLLDLCSTVVGQSGAHLTFEAYLALTPGVFAATPSATLLTASPTNNAEHDWAAQDLNGDAAIDLIVSMNSAVPPARNVLAVYPGLGGGTFGPPAIAESEWQWAFELNVQDIDDDGLLDLAQRIPFIPGQADGLVWYRGVGGFDFEDRASIIPSNSVRAEYALGDFDGDGDLDTVYADRQYEDVLRVETLVRGDIGTNYCSAAVANSTGAIGHIRATGSARLIDLDLTLMATELPAQSFAMFLASRTMGLSIPPLTSGVLCLGGSIGRFVAPGQVGSAGQSGSWMITADPSALPSPTGFVPAMVGELWHFQAWHRDTVGGQATSNYTDAVTVEFL